MAFQLRKNDAVLVYIKDAGNGQVVNSSENVQIGLIKYIGYIHGYERKQYVGIELVESMDNGHNGTINGYEYFECPDGHGIHTEIMNVIRKLKASEITVKMQEIITLCKSRLQQYVQALSERDEYIEELKNKQRELRRLLEESQDRYEIQTKSSSHTVSKKKNNDQNILSPITPSISNDDTNMLSPISAASSSEYELMTHLVHRPTTGSDSAISSSVFLENVNKKHFMFKIPKDGDDSTNNRAIMDTPKIYKQRSRKRSERPNKPSMNNNNNNNDKHKREYTKLSDKYDEETVKSDNSKPRETRHTDWSDTDNEHHNGFQFQDVSDNDDAFSSNHISKVSTIKKKHSNHKSSNFHRNQNKNRKNKVPKCQESKSYTPPKKPSNINTAFIPKHRLQPQYTYSHNPYQQMQSVPISTSHSNPHPVVYQNTLNTDCHGQHNLSIQQNRMRAASNPVTGGMVSYQHPQQQNVMSIHNQQLPQQFVVLYSMPSNDPVMTNNNSYYHWMMQQQQ